MKKLTQFITSDTLFKAVLPSVNELVNLLAKKKSKNKVVKIFYGETYDEFGLTIDSLKYYFILSLLHFFLENKGLKVESIIVQADIASLLNKSVQNKLTILLEQKQQRLDLINRIIEVYQFPIKMMLMSEIFETDRYKQNIELVNQFADTQKLNSPFYENLKKTVLKNRLKQEYQAKFQYAKEAIATSMLFDIKIGPPREQFYDKAQHILAQNLDVSTLVGIYLKPTYPLGQNFAYFLTHQAIEEFGLTPYKAGSNKMNDFRVVLGQTTKKQLSDLINSSFESSRANVAHPVLDLFVIADMAGKLINKKIDLVTYDEECLLSDLEKLKKETIDLVEHNILRNFRNEK